ncbi:hypothetical protein ACINK0_15215 [Deinococcus sp. VB343]|uniref:hypothetical protein n=1 Tax=Deinococcus sp. VB343 TaxID=3385567 RepID=UPI0039C9561E
MTLTDIVKLGLERTLQEAADTEAHDAMRVQANPGLDPEDLGVPVIPVHLSRAQLRLLSDLLRGLPRDGLSQAEVEHLTVLEYTFGQPLHEHEWDAPCPHEALMSTHFRAACGGDTYC